MKFIATCLFILCSYSSFSQLFNISASEKVKYNGTLDFVPTGNGYVGIEIKGKDQLYFFSVGDSRHKITLLKYDKAMQLVKKTELSGGDKIYGPFIPALKLVNGKPHLFYFKRVEKEKKVNILHSMIDADLLEVSSPQTMLTVEDKNFGKMKSSDFLDDRLFTISHSPDRTKILLLWSSGQDNNFYYSALDSSFTILRTKTETIGKEKKFIVQNSCIDNAGNVYAGYGTKGVYVGLSNSPSNTFDIDSGKEPAQVFVSISRNGDILHIAGLYKEGEESHSGAFSQDLNIRDNTFSKMISSDFPFEIKEKLMQETEKFFNDKRKHIYHHFHFLPVIRENGGMDLWGRFTSRHDLPTSTSISSEYGYGSFLYVHFDSKGVAITRIPKRPDRLDVYFYHPFKDKLLLFYNDIDINLDQDITENKKLANDGTWKLFVAIVSEDGSIKREIIDITVAAVPYFQTLTPSSLLVPKVSEFVFNSYNQIELTKKTELSMVTVQLE